jgi:nanoRNase/pAp phosphatase (c-di-AMP/oligoRNAs hydrolase)
MLAVGKSILNRSDHVDIGVLGLEYGGGGHPNAGTCQVAHDDAERSLGEIVATLNGADVATAA